MKSIIQQDRETCFLCSMNTNLEPLDCHHVFGGANRKKSEKYGLKVFLHHDRCHLSGVHKHAYLDLRLKQVAQQRAMKHYGWSTEEFIEIFGKNYI